jgi:hypothetical protein
MTDPHAPRRPPETNPAEVPSDVPESEASERDFPEGQLPGMPLSRDPLREPGPTTGPTEKPPLD